MSGVGVSPPKGFNSWLTANGLSLVSNPNATASAAHSVSTILGILPTRPPLLAPPPVSAPAIRASAPAVPVRPTKKPVEPVIREVICLDGTGQSDKVATIPPVEANSAKTTTVPEVSDEGIENTGIVALSKHWEDKIKPLDGYLPLSIMNINWLKMDFLKNSQRPKTFKDKDGEK